MNRRVYSTVRLVVVFIVAFSFATLSASLASEFRLPSVQLGNALNAPCPVDIVSCSNYWTPSGPAMDTETVQIFTDGTSELANIQSATPNIDLTDTPLTPSIIPGLVSSPNFYVTSTVSEHAYYDIQFMLANNFWGCNFNFGNSTCGIQIRQGIAHVIDKVSFAANDPILQGTGTAIDNPVPPNNGGLSTPNPCAWDSSFPESGANCVVGSPGGTAYRIAGATGANGVAWLQAAGSADMNAAAQHFVNAGLATGFNTTTSVLTGISSVATSHPVNFFIRNDDPARLDLGRSMAVQICYLFTGSYTFPCQYISTTFGPISAFPGYFTSGCGPGLTTCSTGPNLNWWIYTGAFTNVFPFDASLYFTYNSKFVSGLPSIVSPNGPCSSAATPSSNPANYMYLCSPAYDSTSSQMEFAPCLYAPGEPGTIEGGIANFGTVPCTGSSQFSAYNMGLQSEDLYGKNVYSIPIFDRTGDRYAYLSNWQNVVNGDGSGIPNFFTWLDAYSPNPAVAGTVRQGFSQSTISVSPFLAESAHDFYIVGNIYDSLMVPNPLSNGQLVNWMASEQTIPCLCSLTYLPPSGTASTYRFTLRTDLFFQDGRKVTAFDVTFSYLSLMATGAYQSAGLAPITGITILGPTQFDINVNAVGPFTLNYLTSATIMPGHYWTNGGSSNWDAAIANCAPMGASCYPAQYTLTTRAGPAACALTCTFPASLMNPNPSQIRATYDPIASHTLVGSGPWQCGTVTSSGSGVCGGVGCPPICQNPGPGGTFTLTRFGKGFAPASSISGIYFRSNGNLALWNWSGDVGDVTQDFLNYSVIASCFGTSSPNCSRWMMGIGGCGGTPTTPCTIGLQQVAIINRFVGLNWVGPFNWQSSPPAGIEPPTPTLHEGGSNLNPKSAVGCNSPYPVGGYDC